ncbi:MAG: zinc ribbon domain-containing protein, partial [Verrucomicrobiae bacterium]
MTTYIYETIPAKKGGSVRHYEIRQSMKDASLVKHPETGEAIRRVVIGGYGILKSGFPGFQDPVSPADDPA